MYEKTLSTDRNDMSDGCAFGGNRTLTTKTGDGPKP